MQVIRSIGELVEQIEACNTALTEGSDDALRAMFGRFRMDFSGELPGDPFSAEYRAAQLAIYEAVAGRAYGLANERTLFDPAAYAGRPFPYYLQSSFTAGHHLLAIAFLLCKLELPAGARVVEFGPGWGNTTLELARLGFDVTAVDLEPNFCEVIRARAAAAGVAINVVEADFFWAETVVEPFDAAVFFECFHHCDDHMRLLRALRRAVKPGGQVYLASEPIFPAYPVPWGVRMDGEALWAARNFGWMELGFDAAYFREALARTGWSGVRHACKDVHWASVWQLRPVEVQAVSGVLPPIRGDAASWDGLTPPAEEVAAIAEPPVPVVDRSAEVEQLQLELARVYGSTSWRVTEPLRAVVRAARAGLGRRSG